VVVIKIITEQATVKAEMRFSRPGLDFENLQGNVLGLELSLWHKISRHND